MLQRLKLSTVPVLVLAATFAGACDRDSGTFMLDSFEQNIHERLNNVERGLDVIASTRTTATTDTWINDRRFELDEARDRLASIEQDVQERGYVARTELTRMTRDLELAVDRGGPTDAEETGR